MLWQAPRHPLAFHHIRRPSGFSLLELIAAMTILVVVIGILGRIVTDTQRVWRQGADQAQLTTSARAVFAILEDDLSAAMASSNLVFSVQTSASSEFDLILHRMTLNNQSITNRNIQLVHWFSQTNAVNLLQLRRTSTFLLYEGEVWDSARETWITEWAEKNHEDATVPLMLDNMDSLTIRANHPTNQTDQSDQADQSDQSDQTYSSEDHDHLLPAWLDLEIALLPERMARRVPPLTSLKDHATWFSQRFYLGNRDGGRLP